MDTALRADAPAPVDPTAFFNDLAAEGDFFNHGVNGGGGGNWQLPTIYNLLAGITHSVQYDDVGNQKHVVSDSSGPICAAGIALQPKNGSVVSSKYRSTGQQALNLTPTLDTSGAPPPGGGPWNLDLEGIMQAISHQNGVADGTWSDSRGSNKVTMSYEGSSTGALVIAAGDGTGGSWKLDLLNWGALGPDMQLNIWALLMYALMCIAAAAVAVFLPLWAIILIFLAIIIAGLWWIKNHW